MGHWVSAKNYQVVEWGTLHVPLCTLTTMELSEESKETDILVKHPDTLKWGHPQGRELPATTGRLTVKQTWSFCPWADLSSPFPTDYKGSSYEGKRWFHEPHILYQALPSFCKVP